LTFREESDAWREKLLAETRLAEAEIYETIDSTNNRGLALAMEPWVITPCLIWAVKQTAGRGRAQHVWESPLGALTFSLLINPTCIGLNRQPISEGLRPQISLAVGMAVCDVLRELLPQATALVKWPNDIYLNGCKVAGILAEVPDAAANRVVIGIGLNVWNSFADSDQQFDVRPIAMIDAGFVNQAAGEILVRSDDLTRLGHSLTKVLLKLLKSIEQQLEHLAIGRYPYMAWPKYCALQGKMVAISSGEQQLLARALGVDMTGALVVQTEAGQQRIVAGSVRLVDPSTA
jgi:BirA family transcriptional regulator, biotin operon repressor / biotin---[acetyl-CoA-carboxylase] ligase